MERPDKRIRIREFAGLASNRGPLVGNPNGARTLVNMRTISAGVLETRNGIRKVRFD